LEGLYELLKMITHYVEAPSQSTLPLEIVTRLCFVAQKPCFGDALLALEWGSIFIAFTWRLLFPEEPLVNAKTITDLLHGVVGLKGFDVEVEKLGISLVSALPAIGDNPDKEKAITAALYTCWGLMRHQSYCQRLLECEDFLEYLIYVFVRCGKESPRVSYHLLILLWEVCKTFFDEDENDYSDDDSDADEDEDESRAKKQMKRKAAERYLKVLESIGVHHFVYELALCSEYTSIDYWSLDFVNLRLVKMDVDESVRPPTHVTLEKSSKGDYQSSSLVTMACRILRVLINTSSVMYYDLVKLGLRGRVCWLCEKVKDTAVLELLWKLRKALVQPKANDPQLLEIFLEHLQMRERSELAEVVQARKEQLSDHQMVREKQQHNSVEEEKENVGINETKASVKSTPSTLSERHCSNCSSSKPNSGTKLKKCGGCMSVQYCGRY